MAGRQHPLAHKSDLDAEDLRNAEWLLHEPGSGTREEVEQQLLRHLHDLPDIRQISSSEAIKHTLAQGIGISCLSRWVIADLLAAQQLVLLNGVLPPLNRRFFMIRHRARFISPGLARFWSSCSQFANTATPLGICYPGRSKREIRVFNIVKKRITSELINKNNQSVSFWIPGVRWLLPSGARYAFDKKSVAALLPGTLLAVSLNAMAADPRWTFNSDIHNSLAVSPDEKTAVASYSQRSDVVVYDLKSSKVRKILGGYVTPRNIVADGTAVYLSDSSLGVVDKIDTER